MRTLYDVAKTICHDAGLNWTDPRTGETHKSPNKYKPKKKSKK
jgi:hypothetical protein